MKKVFFCLVILLNFVIACNKDEPCDNLTAAKLFYTPGCATINGYVTIAKDGKTYIFQEEINQEFQKDSIDVLISFVVLPPMLLTADCFQNTGIKFNCIQSD